MVSIIAVLPLPKRVPKVLYVVVAVGSYIFILGIVLPQLLEYSRLRKEYPFVSLEQRLSQLNRYSDVASSPIAAPISRLSDEVEHRLREAEADERYTMRSGLLKKLHEFATDDFTLAQGFGQIRMIMPRRERIQLPELMPIPFESCPERSPFLPDGSATDQGEAASIQVPLSFKTLEALHLDGFDDFSSRSRLGYIRDRNHVVGFVPHRFSQMPGTDRIRMSSWTERPQPAIPAPREETRIDWAIVMLELVGLLRHPAPVVYVADHLPELKELETYPTRDLSEFESNALERLRHAEDVVVDDQPNRIRMMGSLRATSGCIRCHEVSRGALLGALSYELIADNDRMP
ncbi:MAG TPA: hypothetical protein VGM98_20585 [Schlesneria sp.]